MIATPEGHRKLFHRRFPAFEILISVCPEQKGAFFIDVTTMSADYMFVYEPAPDEILATSIKTMLVMSQQAVAMNEMAVRNMLVEKGAASVH